MDPDRHVGVSSNSIRIGSQNVTRLSAARFETILHRALLEGLGMIALQEIRHSDISFAWARGMAARAGWFSAVSEIPPPNASAAVTNGGTMLLWRTHLGHAKTHRVHGPNGHRAILAKWPTFAVASLYGPSSKADVDWVDNTLDWIRSFECPYLAVGDLNWREAYAHCLSDGESMTGFIPNTLVGTSPTRAITNHKVTPDGVFFLDGLFHHGFSLFQFLVETERKPAWRLRRTTRYHWDSPDEEC
jgi:hypothetical protein